MTITKSNRRSILFYLITLTLSMITLALSASTQVTMAGTTQSDFTCDQISQISSVGGA